MNWSHRSFSISMISSRPHYNLKQYHKRKKGLQTIETSLIQESCLSYLIQNHIRYFLRRVKHTIGALAVCQRINHSVMDLTKTYHLISLWNLHSLRKIRSEVCVDANLISQKRDLSVMAHIKPLISVRSKKGLSSQLIFDWFRISS